MIELYGDVASKEYQAGRSFRQSILNSWPEVENDDRNIIWIITDAKAHGEDVTDIDILLLASFEDGYNITPFTSLRAGTQGEQVRQLKIKTICATIELKGHTEPNVIFEGNRVKVLYKNQWKDVSNQSHRQGIAVANYTRHYWDSNLWVANLIWLNNIPAHQLPRSLTNILGANFTWEFFLNSLAHLGHVRREGEEWTLNCGSHCDIETVFKLFARPMVPSSLDRHRMEQVIAHSDDSASLQKTLQEQGKLVILRGGGGTGKTMRLLQVARRLFDQEDARVLILTYNKALVADISRLLGFMGIGNDYIEPSIHIKTVHSFFLQLLKDLLIVKPDANDVLDRYEEYKDEGLAYLAADLIDQDFLKQLQDKDSTAVSWDYIFVDEGQDWPQNEQELLLKLYKPGQLMVADGLDQLVRSNQPARWPSRLPNSQIAIKSLDKCIRMKEGLTRFVNAFAAHLGVAHTEWKSNSAAPGGRIILVSGDYLAKQRMHQELLKYNADKGNQPVDMLFCVSPQQAQTVYQEKQGVESKVAQVFKRWGYEVWDATTRDGRESCPTSLEQLRIVQYDSCRGLEGWVVVNLDLENFYNYKRNLYLNQFPTRQGELVDVDQLAHLNAARWLLMPLTRAMDTLVIEMGDQPSPIKAAIEYAANICGDLVERW